MTKRTTTANPRTHWFGFFALSLPVLLAACDPNVTYDATYEVHSEDGVLVTEGQGYGTLGSVVRFGQGASAISIESRKNGGRQAGFTLTFGDGSVEEVSVPYGDSQDVKSKDERVSVRIRVDQP